MSFSQGCVGGGGSRRGRGSLCGPVPGCGPRRRPRERRRKASSEESSTTRPISGSGIATRRNASCAARRWRGKPRWPSLSPSTSSAGRIASVLDVGCGEGAWFPLLCALRPGCATWVSTRATMPSALRPLAQREAGPWGAAFRAALRRAVRPLRLLGHASLRADVRGRARGLEVLPELVAGVAYFDFLSADDDLETGIEGDLVGFKMRQRILVPAEVPRGRPRGVRPRLLGRFRTSPPGSPRSSVRPGQNRLLDLRLTYAIGSPHGGRASKPATSSALTRMRPAPQRARSAQGESAPACVRAPARSPKAREAVCRVARRLGVFVSERVVAARDLVQRAAALDLPAMALVDTNGVSGAPRFWKGRRRQG